MFTVKRIRPITSTGIVLLLVSVLGMVMMASSRDLVSVFVALESDRDAALVISLVLVVVSLVLLVALRGRWWRTA